MPRKPQWTAEQWRAWRRTPAGKASQARYNRTEKAKAAKKAWAKSHNGKLFRRRRQARDRARNTEFIRKAKSVPCADCGQTFPYCCMDFHHAYGQKSFSIGRAKVSCKTLTTLQREIDKCVVICANCHRLRHWKK